MSQGECAVHLRRAKLYAKMEPYPAMVIKRKFLILLASKARAPHSALSNSMDLGCTWCYNPLLDT